MNIKCYYRLYDKSYMGHGCTWKICLNSFINNFNPDKKELIIYLDNCEQTTIDEVVKLCSDKDIEYKITNDGNALGFYNVTVDAISENSDDTIIYFVEGDYLHRPGSKFALIEMFSCFGNNNYVTLYDHPDKYYPFMWDSNYNRYINHCEHGPNQDIKSKIYLLKSGWWRTTNLTCWTYAAQVKTLKEDFEIITKWTKPFAPGKAKDIELFDNLAEKGRILYSPIPSYSGHSACLPGYINWNSYK